MAGQNQDALTYRRHGRSLHGVGSPGLDSSPPDSISQTRHGTAIYAYIGVVPGGSMGRHIWQSHGVCGFYILA